MLLRVTSTECYFSRIVRIIETTPHRSLFYLAPAVPVPICVPQTEDPLHICNSPPNPLPRMKPRLCSHATASSPMEKPLSYSPPRSVAFPLFCPVRFIQRKNVAQPALSPEDVLASLFVESIFSTFLHLCEGFVRPREFKRSHPCVSVFFPLFRPPSFRTDVVWPKATVNL